VVGVISDYLSSAGRREKFGIIVTVELAEFLSQIAKTP
jgi:hypothetical protein